MKKSQLAIKKTHMAGKVMNTLVLVSFLPAVLGTFFRGQGAKEADAELGTSCRGTPEEIYSKLDKKCFSGDKNGPADNIKRYLETKNGRAFYHMVKTTALRPPILAEYQMYFVDESTFKCGTNLLMLEQQYLNREFAHRIGVHDFNMTGQVVAITGASSGMGLALAIECAKRGATVYGVARTRDVFEWGLKIARTAGHGFYLGAKSQGSAEEAAMAHGWTPLDVKSATDFMNEHDPALYLKASNTWLLPQDYYPIYSGQVGITQKVLKSIIFDEVDVRNTTAVSWWLDKIKATHAHIDYLCLNAQTELGMTKNSSSVEDMLADVATHVDWTNEQIIAQSPNRQAGTARTSVQLEFNVGVKFLLAQLVSKFGADTVKAKTDIQFISSTAANNMMAFEKDGKKSKSLMSGNAGWFEYSGAKKEGEDLKNLMISNGYRFNAIAPTVFNTGISLTWVRYALEVFTGDKVGPAHAIIRQKGGKFFYDLTASEVHSTYATVLNSGDKTAGTFIGGATYGALQYLGVYMKDKSKPPLQRRTVFLDNPGVYLAGNTFAPALGPTSAVLRESGLCFDYTDPEQSVGWLEGWRLWNAASGLADHWAVPSLTYLTSGTGAAPSSAASSATTAATQGATDYSQYDLR